MHDDRIGEAMQVIILGRLARRRCRRRVVAFCRRLRQPALQVWPGALSSVLMRQLPRLIKLVGPWEGELYKCTILSRSRQARILARQLAVPGNAQAVP